MYFVYGNSSWYIHGGPLYGGGSLLGGSIIGGSTVCTVYGAAVALNVHNSCSIEASMHLIVRLFP